MTILSVSLLFAIFFVLAFLADRLPFLNSIRAISAIAKNSAQTIGANNIEDSEKRKRLLNNASGIFLHSLKITALVLLVLVIGYLLVWLGEVCGLTTRTTLFSYLETRNGMLLSLIAFFAYFLLKKIYARARV